MSRPTKPADCMLQLVALPLLFGGFFFGFGAFSDGKIGVGILALVAFIIGMALQDREQKS